MSDSPESITTHQENNALNETLHRSMSVWHSFTLGFAVVSPVAGLYAIIGVQTVVAGGGWFAALAVCLLMQLLVATVYAELSSQFPIAGPDEASDCSRRLVAVTSHCWMSAGV